MSAAETVDDESRLAHAIAEFVELGKRGAAPPVDEFVARYADITETLRTCLVLLTAGDEASGTSAPLPRQIGDFRILGVLGRGGMGVVYEAEQISLPRRVALKVLVPGSAEASERMARFRREIEATARLQHSNIVPVYEAGEAAGLPYYAMPLLEGQSVDRVLRDCESGRRPAPLSSRGELVAWVARFIDVARALHAAHVAGILHRDIKPSNLFLERDGRLTILDFGLARSSAEGDVTRTGEAIGTPRYMSPEQILGDSLPLDGRTDQFSLATTLYEVTTGQPAFRGENREALFRAILAEDPTPPRRVDRRMPRDLEVVLLKALEKSPARRYSNLAELADDLQRFLDYEPLRARPVGLLGRTWRKAERNRAAAAAIAVGVLASMSVFVVRSVEARERGRKLTDYLAQAEERMQAGDFAAARDLCLRLEELDPGNATAVNLERAAGLALREQERAERLREAERQAAAAVDSGLAARARLEAVRSRLADLEFELHAERELLPPSAKRRDKARVIELEGELELALRERDQWFREALTHLLSARQLAPESDTGRSEIAALVFDEFREAERHRDDGRAASLWALVEAYGGDDLKREREGHGSIAIASDPPCAEVFLFRYEPLEDLLIPVPYSMERGCDPLYLAAFDTAGPWVCVRVSDVRTHDAKSSLVDGLRPSDEIQFVCGQPPASVAWVVQHLNGLLESTAARGHTIDVRRGNELATVRLPVGSRIELSGEWHSREAFPLRCDWQNCLGQTPVGPLALAMGSYLAVLRLPGFAEVRLPFEITRTEHEGASVPLHALDVVEPGFLCVAGGTAPLGSDPATTESLPAIEPKVPEFFIQRLEVTFAQYFEFLRSLQQTDPTQAEERGPRVGFTPATTVQYWQLDDAGRIQPKLPSDYDLADPVVGVSYDDARAYCDWKTRALGHPNVRFGLPTELEWEKAARGVDGRLFTWGNAFDWTRARLGYSTSIRRPMSGGLYPTDESVYGIRDLVGSVREWCETPELRTLKLLRGACWGDVVESYCHPANRAFVRLAPYTDTGVGFRVVQRIGKP